MHQTAEQVKRRGLAAGRSMDQLRADTLLDFLEGIDPLASTPGPNGVGGGVVEVTIPFDTLTGLAERLG